ncbi:uncharacterized protein LOC124613308 [Schistocerca americana]|uniref:uncharacterized protein LOC124613308 n=1 Tax=Schistocerca americana TaxID=7009 RepID=UPI001F4F3C86|nr:uncharacterized protein LOC124613308 [Schistocerca americana]
MSVGHVAVRRPRRQWEAGTVASECEERPAPAPPPPPQPLCAAAAARLHGGWRWPPASGQPSAPSATAKLQLCLRPPAGSGGGGGGGGFGQRVADLPGGPPPPEDGAFLATPLKPGPGASPAGAASASAAAQARVQRRRGGLGRDVRGSPRLGGRDPASCPRAAPAAPRIAPTAAAAAATTAAHATHAPAQSPPPDSEQGDPPPRKVRRPFYRRFLSYVKQAWTGVKFALDPELEDLETPPRYRPDSLEALCKATRFTEDELKRIYRGFKAECPTGVVREDTFKGIYSRFFPQGANAGHYAHYVFNTLDQDHSGLLSFEDFVVGLSILSRGTLDEKLRWTFSLYDINGDGCITRDEMTDIVTAIYELTGRLVEPSADDATVNDKVERIFQKMDANKDGVVTLEEFLDCCSRDEDISRSMAVFDSAF